VVAADTQLFRPWLRKPGSRRRNLGLKLRVLPLYPAEVCGPSRPTRSARRGPVGSQFSAFVSAPYEGPCGHAVQCPPGPVGFDDAVAVTGGARAVQGLGPASPPGRCPESCGTRHLSSGRSWLP